jgi:hypothetical protein
MNIFVLDLNQELCAQYHVDRHVVKMILETAQLLCTSLRFYGADYGYKMTHINHPCSIWARESRENFNWLKKLGMELCKEYTFRFGKIHKSQEVIEKAFCENIFSKKIIAEGLTEFAQAMPENYKGNEPVIAYRNYYKNEKKHLFKYTKRDAPKWLE